MTKGEILGVRVDCTDYTNALRFVLQSARSGRSGYVCMANVHTIMEAYDRSDFRAVVARASMVAPDGMPLVWALRAIGFHASRVYGPELTEIVLKAANEEGIPVGFYGGSPEVLARLIQRSRRLYGAQIAYASAPPFRPLRPEEDERITGEINASGCRILFVGLGCPKQERWMAEHVGRVQALMLGVGAAFDFLSGAKPQAPRWMQQAGLEWFFRLLVEPRRLWRRYLIHNPRFATLFTLQLLGLRRFAT